MNSKDYWAEREAEALKHYITDEAEYQKQLNSIYANMLDACQKEIDSFYARYASAEGISIAEAKKRVSKLDIAAYERKAKRYVQDKDFSAKANEEMRLYNATMKINRLEMLKANIGMELIAGHDELEKFMAGILKGRTEEELARQAGILGKTVRNNAAKANAIVNGSFKVAKVGSQSTFSDRIWQYQDIMRQDLGRILQQGLIQGKNPRALTKDLRKYWYGPDPKTGGGAKYCMERLMRTELARVQTEAQKQSFDRNGFDKYIFIVNGGCCDICDNIANSDIGYGKGVYLVKDMMPGENASPVHPNCRCSTAAWEDSEEYEAWLDHLANGGTTEEWNKTGRAQWQNTKAAKLSQENQTVSIPESINGNFDDFEPLDISEADRKALENLNQLSIKTNHEYAVMVNGKNIGEAFTSGTADGVQIDPAKIKPGTSIFHSHTNVTPLSAQDFIHLLKEDVEKIGNITYNGDVYIASVGDGWIPSMEEFADAIDIISMRANIDIQEHPDFWEWSVEERNYMAIREQAYQIAREFGWKLEGGRLDE